jgi:hypothetical protein
VHAAAKVFTMTYFKHDRPWRSPRRAEACHPEPTDAANSAWDRRAFPGRARARMRAAAAAIAMLAWGGTAQACADVALVLAIDASGSVQAAEFALQQQGYARAFRSSRVQAALAAAGVVDVGVVVWGDTEWAAQVLPLVRLRSVADAMALAQRIEALPRRVSGNTGIGRAIWTATDLLETQAGCALRRVINLSGDGTETLAPRPRRIVPLVHARQRATDAGITINALAIETESADLGLWYQDKLITGQGAFVMEVVGYADFAQAIEEKLIREVAPPAVSALPTFPVNTTH